ncbi:MAG: hypothetical protein H7835_12595, partial [Magnetococcus sp. XQGC-1]
PPQKTRTIPAPSEARKKARGWDCSGLLGRISVVSVHGDDGCTFVIVISRKRIGQSSMLYRWLIACFMALCVGACQEIPVMPIAKEHLQQSVTAKPDADKDIPDVVKVSPYLPTVEKNAQPERYTVVLHDVPIRDLLFPLARDSNLNIDIHPDIEGRVTINAVEQTLPKILERLATQVEMIYEFNKGVLVIRPDRPFWHTYSVDYLNLKRKSTSKMGLSLEAGKEGVSSSSSSSSDVDNSMDFDFWGALLEGIRKIVKLDQIEDGKLALKRQGNSAKSRKSTANVDNSDEVDHKKDKEQKGDEFLVTHQGTGVISVLASKKQHAQIQIFLDQVTSRANRQVLIEATIVEVRLNHNYFHGVDWRRVTGGRTGINMGSGDAPYFDYLAVPGGGWTSTAGGSPFSGALPFFALAQQFADGASPSQTLSVSLKLLDEYGKVSVLSSPKVIALNNQTALMKVANEKAYFEYQEDEQYNTTGDLKHIKRKFEKKTALEGLLLAVTPNINESGIISLHVRPTISDSLGSEPVPSGQGSVPLFRIREMESVLRVPSGQTVVLGGLMRDVANNDKVGFPGLMDNIFLGNFFSTTRHETYKTEMAIFIKPTIMAPDNIRQSMSDVHFSLGQSPQSPAPIPALN